MTITLDLGRGEIRCEGTTLATFPEPPPFLLEMITHGGLLPRVKTRVTGA
ncbi:hypothetical protein ACFQ3Z_44115 [Streptomyces nogalater]